MFLEMIENNDIRSVKMFRTMNISREFMHYIIMSTTLSIITIISKNNYREYVDDLNINIDKIKYLFNETKFHRITLDVDELKKTYNLFRENYFYKEIDFLSVIHFSISNRSSNNYTTPLPLPPPQIFSFAPSQAQS